MRWLEPEITAPATTAPVSLDEAKLHLRVDASDEDPLIEVLIDAAQAYVEKFTGLYLAEQTIKLRAWSLDERTFILPAGPVSAVTSITYLDSASVQQTVSTDLYVSALYGLSPYVSLVSAASWPAHLCQLASVTVTVTAGFADGECPAPIRQAILLYVGDLYANREAVVIDASRVTMIENPTAERLLANYRRAYV
jgi:uncharacterized phiE125 gp8 family phage protein